MKPSSRLVSFTEDRLKKQTLYFQFTTANSPLILANSIYQKNIGYLVTMDNSFAG